MPPLFDGDWLAYRGHFIRRTGAAGALTAQRVELMLALDRVIEHAAAVGAWTYRYSNTQPELEVGAALQTVLRDRSIAITLDSGAAGSPLRGSAGGVSTGLAIRVDSSGDAEKQRYQSYVDALDLPPGVSGVVVLNRSILWSTTGTDRGDFAFGFPWGAAPDERRSSGWLLPRISSASTSNSSPPGSSLELEALRAGLITDSALAALLPSVPPSASLGEFPLNSFRFAVPPQATVNRWHSLLEVVAHEFGHHAFWEASEGARSGGEGDYCDGPDPMLALLGAPVSADAHYSVRLMGNVVADQACWGFPVGFSHQQFCCAGSNPLYRGRSTCP